VVTQTSPTTACARKHSCLCHSCDVNAVQAYHFTHTSALCCSGGRFHPPAAGGGTPHKPSIIGPSGHTLHESTSCAQYLLDQGAHPSALLKETSSFDTVGNAYFGLTIHALPAAWRRVAVVTSDFHMNRSRHLFNDIWGLAGQAFYGSRDW
jgi:uncharacterized SAM-binding protein YcdF (DUF218 family)